MDASLDRDFEVLSGPLVAASRLWYSRMLMAAPTTASPRDAPMRRAGEGPADRVLLFGNGVLHGWGVPSTLR